MRRAKDLTARAQRLIDTPRPLGGYPLEWHVEALHVGDLAAIERHSHLGGATERARFVIGADGRNSGLAESVRAQAYEQTPTLTCWFFLYWSGVPDEGLKLYLGDRHAIFAFPTSDGLFAVFVGCERPACKLVFYDTTRSGTRRWHAESPCGNRERQRRYRAASGASSPTERR